MDSEGHTPDHEQEKIEQLRRVMYSRSLSENLKDRERRSMHDTQPVVGRDWTREEPAPAQTLVAPLAIALSRSIVWWVLAGAVVFFIGAGGFFLYYFTFGGGALPASPGNVVIDVSGPLNVAGGEPVNLQITVTNKNQVSLELADLLITYPRGTRSPTNSAVELSNQRISFGSIEPGGRRQGTVPAIFAGAEGEDARVLVELEYRLEGSSAIFVSSSDYSLTFASSPLSISVHGNSETIAGQATALTVDVVSSAETDIARALLTVSYPFGFSFSSSNPQQARSGVWELGDFEPGEKKTIVLRGVLSGESGDERVFRFSAGTPGATEHTIETVFDEVAHRMTVSKPFLSLTIAVNGTSGGNVVVSPGENVTASIAYQNNLSVTVTDAVIVARLAGLPVEGSDVLSLDGFYRSSDGAVLWDKNTTKGVLASIPAGARGFVSFSFRIPGSSELLGIQDPRLTITTNASGKRLSESGVPENLQANATQSVRVASALVIAAEGLYYSSPFGSVGPMPPSANKETTYAIVFTLTNTTNRVEGAVLSATLPPYVRWVGVYSPPSEQVTFNAQDGVITWNVGDIETQVGVGGTVPRQAAVSIGFTPSTSQIGQQPILLQDIQLRGVDAATGKTVTHKAPDITTNIVGDPAFSPVNATVVR